jgi:glycosyltransferase involved in cell wall biosynthesis
MSVVTYNQESYIEECLDGILMQQTTFPFEIILGEDESSDGTRDICQAYAEKYPDKIKLFLRSRKDVIYINGNATGRFNMIENLKACTGRYIALCEGDDYWTDPLKLQKQVDLLEANPELVACHHWQKAAKKKGDSFEEIEAPKEGHGYFPYETDVKAIFENKMRVKTRTVMFRNIFDPAEIIHNFPKAAFGDVPLSFVLGKYGRFGYIDEEMAVYRQTTTGVSTAGLKELGLKNFKVQHFKNWIEIWDYADRFYEFKYHKEATETVLGFYKTITDNLPKTIGSFIKVLYYDLFIRRLPFHRKIVSSNWIILYYRKKLGYRLKRKLRIS